MLAPPDPAARLRVALWQAAGAPGQVEANLQRLDAAAAAAAQRGAQVLVSPELFATGYAMDAGAGGEHVEAAVRATAARTGVAQVWSEPWDGAITAAVCDGSGRLLGRYRKVHLWGPGERGAFAPGAAAPLVVRLGGLRVGVAVCFDVEFPETARAAGLAGVDVLCVPTAIEEPAVAQVLLPARALENGMALLYANHAAGLRADGLLFCGGSVALGPDGSALARAGHGEELLVADVSGQEVAAVRDRFPYLAQLREHVYRDWTDRTDRSEGSGVGDEPA
ncbi:nitrilase-related carbon-nitrogen hydrolase [Quadrisphaera sp. DSM 44207]|uniref:nitrilase-related carbon-nitrogen hydrolase n=1 Tax=Quadrisphaera sp. DSM 44207 TaxID=1881057 RepID=UPI000881DC36|nr:nitrilase-related carbon-nitrogen hydrolase [Quadrisphaera sp. DSM 44207]SDQ39766.1 Predicted amidohydrolase [Quadrisphaera sp. DSM 44207]